MNTKSATIRSKNGSPPAERGPSHPIPLARGAGAPRQRRGLNPILADTLYLRDMFKKHHWQAAGATFYQPHLLSGSRRLTERALLASLSECPPPRPKLRRLRRPSRAGSR